MILFLMMPYHLIPYRTIDYYTVPLDMDTIGHTTFVCNLKGKV